MVLNKFTGSTLMDGNEDSLFKIVGTAMKTFASYIYLKALQAGDTIRLRVYNKVDDVSHWKLDGDVTDSVGGNNGTVQDEVTHQSSIPNYESVVKGDQLIGDGVKTYDWYFNLNGASTLSGTFMTATIIGYLL